MAAIVLPEVPLLLNVGLFLFAVCLGYLTAFLIHKSRSKRYIQMLQSTPHTAQSEKPLTEHDAGESQDYEECFQIPYKGENYAENVMMDRSRTFYENMNRRRSVRMFSDRPFPLEVIHNVLKTAGTAPSGAHTQPWMYVVVSDPEVKSHIRVIIEEEERINYERRMGEKWLNDLKPMKTSWQKPYLTRAPYLIIVFKQISGLSPDGEKKTHYYSEISIAISVGLLVAALQNAGLATVTSTPMNAGPALRSLLKRPSNEKAILLLPVGYPDENATVPSLKRKPLSGIMIAV